MSIQTKLTKEIAFAAMDELHTTTGANITVKTLLKHLGKGSKSTLTEWKVEQLKRLSACEIMPSELKDRMFQMLSQI